MPPIPPPPPNPAVGSLPLAPVTVAVRVAQPEGAIAMMEHAEHALALMPEGTACVTTPRTAQFATLENPALAGQILADFVRKHRA